MSSYRQYTHCTFLMCFIRASMSWLALKIIFQPVLHSPNCRVNYWSYLMKFSKNPWRIRILVTSERGIESALSLWNVTIRSKLLIYTNGPKLFQGKILKQFNGYFVIHIIFSSSRTWTALRAQSTSSHLQTDVGHPTSKSFFLINTLDAAAFWEGEKAGRQNWVFF